MEWRELTTDLKQKETNIGAVFKDGGGHMSFLEEQNKVVAVTKHQGTTWRASDRTVLLI